MVLDKVSTNALFYVICVFCKALRLKIELKGILVRFPVHRINKRSVILFKIKVRAQYFPVVFINPGIFFSDPPV